MSVTPGICSNRVASALNEKSPHDKSHESLLNVCKSCGTFTALDFPHDPRLEVCARFFSPSTQATATKSRGLFVVVSYVYSRGSNKAPTRTRTRF